MPELPDNAAYVVALKPRVVGEPLERMRIASPFLLRSVAPPPSSFEGRRVNGLRRLRLPPGDADAHRGGLEEARLHAAVVSVLEEWVERLGSQAKRTFPEKVTAFREEMAVHGRYGKACPVCGSPVQRIRYADNESNYCATCQTGGKLLADRGLSRLLGSDWPRTLDELETFRAVRRAGGPPTGSSS